MSGAHTAVAVVIVAAAVLLAASLAAAGAPPGAIGPAAHAATHDGKGDGDRQAAGVIGVRWAIVDAVVAAGSDARGRDGAVVIAGTTDRPGEPVLVTARAPDGSVLDRIAAKASPRDGSFLAEVPTGGIGWAPDGLYTVTAYQDGVAGARPAPYVDIVPVAMSGGLAEPNAELSGAPVPAGAAEAGRAEPRVLNLKWSLIEEVSLAPGGGAAGGDAVRLSGAAPDGRDSVTVRVVAPTGLEIASFAAGAGGPPGAFEALLVTDGSAWSQDGTYRITVDGGLPGSYPDLLLVDVFDGSVVVAASAAAAAADPRGDGDSTASVAGPAWRAGGAGALLEKRWEIIDAVAVSGQGGQGQRVVIAGSTDRPAVPVSVRVLDPQGRHAHGSSVLPDARTGQFVVDMPAAGDAWSPSGTYTARVEQRDALTGTVHYSDLLGLDVDGGGAVAAQPRLPAALLPPAVAAGYGDALLVALEYAVVEAVRAEAPEDDGGGGTAGRYAEIAVYGRTFDRSGPVSVAAEAPDGSAAPPVSAEPGGDGRFEARLPVSGPFWSADGEYTITVTREGAARPQFVDIAVVDVRDGAVEAGRPAPAAAADGDRPNTSPRIINIGERWGIIDSIVLAEGPDARQSVVIAGTTDVVDRAVQATVEAPGGGTVDVREAMPDASGAVVIEVPVGGAAWGEPRPADGTYALTVGQPGTRYLDGYPLYVLGGRISAPAEFGGAPAPLPPSAAGYESARLLDVAWSLVTRADVATAADGSPAAVVIRGETGHPKVPVSVRAEAPGGLVIYDMPAAPRADGSFEARIDASGSGWAADGSYRITVRQGFDSVPPDLVIVEVVDGAVVPEFGALATAALAAAVVAAVAAAVVAAPRLGLAGPLLPRA